MKSVNYIQRTKNESESKEIEKELAKFQNQLKKRLLKIFKTLSKPLKFKSQVGGLFIGNEVVMRSLMYIIT